MVLITLRVMPFPHAEREEYLEVVFRPILTGPATTVLLKANQGTIAQRDENAAGAVDGKTPVQSKYSADPQLSTNTELAHLHRTLASAG